MQFNAYLNITVAIHYILKDNFYERLGVVSLETKPCFIDPCFVLKNR